MKSFLLFHQRGAQGRAPNTDPAEFRSTLMLHGLTGRRTGTWGMMRSGKDLTMRTITIEWFFYDSAGQTCGRGAQKATDPFGMRWSGWIPSLRNRALPSN